VHEIVELSGFTPLTRERADLHYFASPLAARKNADAAPFDAAPAGPRGWRAWTCPSP
jgi:hypothetical protein